jgi:hypothetical protein
MWSDLYLALKAMDLKQANEILAGVDVLTALTNPWVIAVMILTCIALLIRTGEKAVITFLSFPAFMVLYQKTVQNMNVMELEKQGQDLMIFIGGFLAIAAVNVYFHFVR